MVYQVPYTHSFKNTCLNVQLSQLRIYHTIYQNKGNYQPRLEAGAAQQLNANAQGVNVREENTTHVEDHNDTPTGPSIQHQQDKGINNNKTQNSNKMKDSGPEQGIENHKTPNIREMTWHLLKGWYLP